MKSLLSILLASMFAVTGSAALAAEPPKAAAPAATKKAALEKPASVTSEAWMKMSDADKAKAVEAAKSAPKDAAAKAPKKKGGC